MFDRISHGDLLRQAAEHAGILVDKDALRPPLDKNILVNNTFRLHYIDWESPFSGAHPIVFLHGGGLNAHTWDLVALQLRTRYHCLALDLRGHGDSEWSPEMDYRLETFVSDVVGFVDALNLRRISLVGQSLGGLIAMSAGTRLNDRLISIVIVDIGPEMRIEGVSRIMSFLEEEIGSIDELIERAVRFNPRRNPAMLRRTLLYNLRPLPDGGWMWKHDRRRRPRDASDAEVINSFKSLWGAVDAIHCPVLIVRGEESDVFAAEDAAKLSRAFSNAELRVVPGAGHNVQGDNPVGLAHVLSDFLSRHGV
jgi:esterase